ncbi:hypothetical protein F2P81_018395 [Scophthalmus maximus]|uniref:Uncharacterized protein n=1 Tax=Scophthalmus maximus TaxID=52904 RepID=A0A6A4SC40_SCOMX|nr:hypothetical protein F2P81_018395 [Scophthalmus maximus]
MPRRTPSAAEEIKSRRKRSGNVCFHYEDQIAAFTQRTQPRIEMRDVTTLPKAQKLSIAGCVVLECPSVEMLIKIQLDFRQSVMIGFVNKQRSRSFDPPVSAYGVPP